MDEKKGILEETSSDMYDASDKPFDFVGEGIETVLVCESDPSIRSKIINVLKDGGYRVTESNSADDAIKSMRFHVYQLIVLNENYETDKPDSNIVLQYINDLPMSTRRNIFVTLISGRFRTMDNMAAFNRSVNIVINSQDIDDIGAITKRGMVENEAFYHVFKETLRKTGRI